MTIYVVMDPVAGNNMHFCPDQATVDRAVTLGFAGTFVVGTEDQAAAQLAANQKAFLTAEISARHIYAVKATSTDPFGNPYWSACDLTKEILSDTAEYMVFDDIQVQHTPVIGTTNALAEWGKSETRVLAHFNLDAVILWDKLPTPNLPSRGA